MTQIYSMAQAYHMAGIHHRDHDIEKDLRMETWLGTRRAATIEYTTDMQSVQRHADLHGLDIIIIKEKTNVSKS